MASRAVQSLLASRHERSSPHRIVVRVGAAVAWVAAAIYLAAGLLTGDGTLFIEAVGPILAAALMTAQVLLGREDAGLALFGSGLVVAIWYSAFGDEGTIVPAAVALVLIAALGMLFVVEHRTVVAATLAGALFGIPHLWSLTTEEQVTLGAIMALSFIMTHLILGSIQSASAAMNARYQMLFEESPAAALEEDWSEAVDYVRSEYSGKPARIRQFLLAYPAVVRRAVAKAKILRANDAALRLLDISKPERLIGYRDPEIVTDENIESFVSALVCLYEGGKAWESEVPLRTRSGDLRWLLYRSVDTSTGTQGSTIVSGLADITHIKEKNAAMSEVVRAKDEFVANVSHELRTPLTAVIGLTSELANDVAFRDSEWAELLQLVASQAAEMSNIVDDLLVAARAEVGTVTIELQPVDLAVELQATLDGLAMAVETPSAVPPPVSADPRRVRQILRNLLTNAQRYGGPRCRVVMGTTLDSVWLEVRDDGSGLSDDDAARIFDPYVTSGGKESVGLGLAVARQLARLMGGDLAHERSAAETVFRLHLPMAGQSRPVLASQSESV
jgi:signal transduction histidine kinase